MPLIIQTRIIFFVDLYETEISARIKNIFKKRKIDTQLQNFGEIIQTSAKIAIFNKAQDSQG